MTPDHVRRSGGDHYRLRVLEGKDTSGDGGNPRDAYLPASVERDLYQYQRAEDLEDSDPCVDLSMRGVRDAVNRAADRTGDEDFREVSSHDLRRRFAQWLLVNEGMNPA